MSSSLNYQEWKNRHQQILESLPGKRLTMFFSGGKDSSLVLHFIQKAADEFRFSFETHAGIYPHKKYRPKRLFAQYYEQMGLRFDFEKVFRFAQTALHVPDENFFTQIGEDRYLKKLI